VEVRVQPDEQDNEQVPQHCGQVHGQEQGIEPGLILWLDGEPQEDEFRYTGLITPLHAVLLFYERLKDWKFERKQYHYHYYIIKIRFQTSQYMHFNPNISGFCHTNGQVIVSTAPKNGNIIFPPRNQVNMKHPNDY
jgi:hypothetical protein